MIVFACYNIKGGVGKTASAVNLASLAAAEGWRTLLWDLDPQAAATFYYRVKAKPRHSGRRILRPKRALDTLVMGTDYMNLDLIPADFSARNMDLHLEEFKNPTHRLGKLLKPLRKTYDYVFLDCPPGISLLSESLLQATNALLVPVIPTTLSLRTLDQLLRFTRKQGLKNLGILPFFSMVDRRKQLHRLIVEHPPQTPTGFLQTHIPYASEVEQMGTHRAPLCSYTHRSPAAIAYSALWQEIKEHMASK